MQTEPFYLYLFKAAYLEVNCAHASQGLSSQPYKNQVTFSLLKHSYQCKIQYVQDVFKSFICYYQNRSNSAHFG